jgi:hypothetical protein
MGSLAADLPTADRPAMGKSTKHAESSDELEW